MVAVVEEGVGVYVGVMLGGNSSENERREEVEESGGGDGDMKGCGEEPYCYSICLV